MGIGTGTGEIEEHYLYCILSSCEYCKGEERRGEERSKYGTLVVNDPL
jgi:hypothetical protein